MYAMILLGIRLFLRSEELITLKETSFDFSLSAVDRGIIEALAIEINGKTDQEFLTLSTDREQSNSLLCPLIHLQSYVYLIKWKGGNLFPSAAELLDPPGN